MEQLYKDVNTTEAMGIGEINPGLKDHYQLRTLSSPLSPSSPLSSLFLYQLLTGHEGPVSSLAFCPSRALLVSGSWDKTVRLWDVFEQKGNIETLVHIADG